MGWVKFCERWVNNILSNLIFNKKFNQISFSSSTWQAAIACDHPSVLIWIDFGSLCTMSPWALGHLGTWSPRALPIHRPSVCAQTIRIQILQRLKCPKHKEPHKVNSLSESLLAQKHHKAQKDRNWKSKRVPTKLYQNLQILNFLSFWNLIKTKVELLRPWAGFDSVWLSQYIGLQSVPTTQKNQIPHY